MNSFPKVNIDAFYGFLKLEKQKQADVLKHKAIKLDSDVDGNQVIHLYFIDGFFVEEIRSCNTGTLISILPYKTGYRLAIFLHGKLLLS